MERGVAKLYNLLSRRGFKRKKVCNVCGQKWQRPIHNPDNFKFGGHQYVKGGEKPTP